MSEKPKHSLERAMRIGEHLMGLLAPLCDRVEIVGSCRREKRLVSDVELLMVPKFVQEKDLFGSGAEVRTNLVRERIEGFLAEGKIVKRLKENGVSSWGEQNLHAAHVKSGLPLDFFFASERSWVSLLVCRTGPARLNVILAQRATARGMHWNPYQGLMREGVPVEVADERAFFELLGLKYYEPRLRAMLLPAWARGEG